MTSHCCVIDGPSMFALFVGYLSNTPADMFLLGAPLYESYSCNVPHVYIVYIVHGALDESQPILQAGLYMYIWKQSGASEEFGTSAPVELLLNESVLCCPDLLPSFFDGPCLLKFKGSLEDTSESRTIEKRCRLKSETKGM